MTCFGPTALFKLGSPVDKLNDRTSTFPGFAQASVIFARYVFDVNVLLKKVQFNAFAQPPVGQDLILRFDINSVENVTDFTLGDGLSYAEALAGGGGISIPAGQTIEPKFTQVGTTQPGTEVTIFTSFETT